MPIDVLLPKASNCLNCGKLFDSAASLTHEQRPGPGDFTVCIDCGHLMAFTDELSLRELTVEEQLKVAGDADLLHTQRALADLKEAERLGLVKRGRRSVEEQERKR